MEILNSPRVLIGSAFSAVVLTGWVGAKTNGFSGVVTAVSILGLTAIATSEIWAVRLGHAVRRVMTPPLAVPFVFHNNYESRRAH